LVEPVGKQMEQSRGGAAVLGALLIVAGGIVLAAYWPALSSQAFLFDDDQYVIENGLVQNPGWDSAKRFLTEVLAPSTVRGYYQPLTMISLMLDWAMGARVDDLRIFHQTSILLHVANSLLLSIFLYLLFAQAWPAVIGGLLYGLHPVTIEAVAWVSERKTVLATFFALWCLISHVLYVRKVRWWYLAISAAAYVLALLSKPTVIAMPVLFLLLDIWPFRRLGKRTIVEKIPFFAVCAASAIITYVSQSRTSLTKLPGESGLGRIAMTFCHNIVFYLYNLLWPVDLSWYYPFPEPFDLSNRWVLFTIVGTCVLLVALGLSAWWTGGAAAGWLFFFLAILPTMGVIGFHPVIAADRHMYFPMVGFLMAVTYYGGLLWCKAGAGNKWARPLLLVAVTILAASEFIMTRRYLRHWRDSEHVYEYMLEYSPNVAILHNNLANFLGDKGRLEEAVSHFERSLELKPASAEVHNNLGNVLWQLGRDTEALTHYRAALKLKPHFAPAHYNLAGLLAENGQLDEAIIQYRKALEIKDDYVEAWTALGWVLAQKGEPAEAVECYERAVKLRPGYILAHGRLALVLAKLDRIEEAIKQCRIVLKARPNDFEMHFNVGYLLEIQGKTDEAIEHYRRAVAIKSDYDQARQRLKALQSSETPPPK